MKRKISIVEFAEDPNLLNISDLSVAQKALLKGIYNEDMTPEERDVFGECTKRSTAPRNTFLVAVCSAARSGKTSKILVPILVYEILLGGHQDQLAVGETMTCPLIAQNSKSSTTAFSYLLGVFQQSPILNQYISDVTTREIRLDSLKTKVVCYACSSAATRGTSIAVAGLDEVDHFSENSTVGMDAEILASVRRGTINFKSSPKIILTSTPKHKNGILYALYKEHFGTSSDDVLVWQSDVRTMNPSISEATLERERRLDPIRYAREYGGMWIESEKTWLPSEWIDNAVVENRFQLPPRDGVTYTAAVDSSGGVQDAFTCCILRKEEDNIVVDYLNGWSPGKNQTIDLESTVKEISEILKRYRITEVTGDKYSAEWVRQAFQRNGIRYLEAPMDKSRAYEDSERYFAEGKIQLLDHSELQRELRSLEVKQLSGRRKIDHPKHGSDDYSNAVALAVASVSGSNAITTASFSNWAKHEDRSWMVSRSRNAPSMQSSGSTPNFTNTLWSFER